MASRTLADVYAPLVIVLFVAVFGAYFLMFSGHNAQIMGLAVAASGGPNFTCSDSDGGLNPLIKGTAVLTDVRKKETTQTRTDECNINNDNPSAKSNILKEWSCKRDLQNPNRFKLDLTPIDCRSLGVPCGPRGCCSRGACCEDNATFCAARGANCGVLNATDNCGTRRVVNCGLCAPPNTCRANNTCSNEICGNITEQLALQAQVDQLNHDLANAFVNISNLQNQLGLALQENAACEATHLSLLLQISNLSAQIVELREELSATICDKISVRTFNVDGRQLWQNTGVTLSQGARVAINASGIVYFCNGQTCPQTPDGDYAPNNQDFPCNEQGYVSNLIGKIGDGPCFSVNNGVALTADSSGVLYLGVNDYIFGDNSGNWNTQILVNEGDQSNPLCKNQTNSTTPIPSPLFYCSFNDTLVCSGGKSPTLAEGLTFKAGVSGRGVYIDGNDALDYSAAGNIMISEGTISTWVIPDWNAETSPQAYIVDVFDRYGGSNSFSRFGMRSTNYPGESPLLRYEVNPHTDGGAYGADIKIANFGWRAGEPHQVVLTWNIASGMVAYVDGHKVGLSTQNFPMDFWGLSKYINVGYYKDTHTHQFNGVIDELSIYDTQLSDEQVASLHLQHS